MSNCARCNSTGCVAVFTVTSFTVEANPMVAHPWVFNMAMCAPCSQHFQNGVQQALQPALGLQKPEAQGVAPVIPLKIVPPPPAEKPTETVKPPKEPKP